MPTLVGLISPRGVGGVMNEALILGSLCSTILEMLIEESLPQGHMLCSGRTNEPETHLDACYGG